jgi:hypothetical protein
MKVALAASGFDCTTVEEAGWSVKENGELLPWPMQVSMCW